MNEFWKWGWRVALIMLAAATLGVADTMPPPGTLNYTEGQVQLNGVVPAPNSASSSTLEPGQILRTWSGNAELLLTPGVYLRVGHNSEVQMVSPGLTNTVVRLVKGHALVEVDELYKQNHIEIQMDGAATTLEKNGLYDFDTRQASVRVLDGKARVEEQGRQVQVKKGREVLLAAGERFRAQKFDKDAVQSTPLYAWSQLRSEYDSEANVQTADNLMMYGGWYGSGWYWDPYWDFWSFLPGDGILWGPFGWGFYSPGWVGYAPYFGYVPYYGYPRVGGHGIRPGVYGRRGRPSMRGFATHGYGRAGNFGARGFGGRGFAGGFHGGGAGGFQGGFGGGFHGGGRGR